MEAPSSDALMPERRRCPLKPWGPAGGMVFGGTRRRGFNNTSMSEDDNPFQTRGRKARMGLPAKCMHFVGSPGWRGNSNSPRDEQPIRSAPEHNEDFDRVSRITHKRLPFERKRKRKRQKGHFPSCPLCKPQNSSYPHKGKASERETFAPLSKGAKGKRQEAEKRDGNKQTSKDKVETIKKVCSFAIKARDGRPLRACFDFNLTSLSRERKF